METSSNVKGPTGPRTGTGTEILYVSDPHPGWGRTTLTGMGNR
jgi:hypothetical protein